MKKFLIVILCLAAVVIAASFFISSPPVENRVEKESSLSLSPSRNPKRYVDESELVARATVIDSNAFEIDSLKTVFKTGDDQLPEAREQFISRLKNNPALFSAALKNLQKETDAEFAKYLAGILDKNSDAVGRQILHQAIFELAQENDSMERRITALRILSDIGQVNAATLGSITKLAQTDASPEIRAGAVEVLGSWLRDSNARSLADQTATALVQAISHSTNGQVRNRGLNALAMQDAKLSAEILKQIPDLLQKDTNPANRALAASVLGMAADDAKDFALEKLENALTGEREKETRQMIASQMVRLGRTNALERIKKISGGDVFLVQQLEAYLKMIQESPAQ